MDRLPTGHPRFARSILVLLLCAACASSTPPATPPGPTPPRDLAAQAAEAEGMFRAFEDRMARAENVLIMSRAKATGSVQVEFTGRLLINDDRVHMDFDGAFLGQPKEMLLISDGRGMGLNNTGGLDAPPLLIQALIIGFTRMGLAHNVVRGFVDQPPDHAEAGGDLRAWLSVDSFSFGEIDTLRGRKVRPVHYRLLVDNEPSADATLWLDVDTGLPLQRRMVVHFKEGDMQVVESYGRLTVEP